MVINVLNTLKRSFLAPIKALKMRYIPLLMIYFAYGSQALAGVALTFWEKENLSLSAEELITVGIWVWLPFNIKMVFGQLVDVVSVFGSRRRVWIFIGAALMVLGYLMLYGMSVQSVYINWLGNEFNRYLAANLIMILGFVIQDVTADAMTTEVVDRSQNDEDIKAELAMIQVLGRLALMIAIAITGGLGGYLAANFSYSQVFLMALIIPAISVLGACFVRLNTVQADNVLLSPVIFGGGLAFAVFTILIGFSDIALSQEITFLVSIVLICWMLSNLMKHQDPMLVKSIILTFIALFAFRAAPNFGSGFGGPGPGFNWWAIDELGFDQAFFGVLRQISGIGALVLLWFASDFITKKSIRSILIMLVIVGTLFSVPDLMLIHGIHEQLGISARTIALFDTAAESPLVHISMIPMLAMIAYYAPEGQRATWFAVSASLMNTATTAGDLITKYLNKFFVVTREIKDSAGLITTAADYSQLMPLLWTAVLISLIMPLTAIFLCLRHSSVKAN